MFKHSIYFYLRDRGREHELGEGQWETEKQTHHWVGLSPRIPRFMTWAKSDSSWIEPPRCPRSNEHLVNQHLIGGEILFGYIFIHCISASVRYIVCLFNMISFSITEIIVTNHHDGQLIWIRFRGQTCMDINECRLVKGMNESKYFWTNYFSEVRLLN